jgi:hypothetical protein
LAPTCTTQEHGLWVLNRNRVDAGAIRALEFLATELVKIVDALGSAAFY